MLKIAKNVAKAIANGDPVVALESTIITHGLPFPTNLEMAREVEKVIIQEGATPASIGFLNGSPIVGLNNLELEFLAKQKNCHKVSRRDIAYVMANKLNGGTTISGTMILANKANINVFATGGLGGVHRGANETLDISADLEELGRTPVAVVCSGPKSILDIPKTMEYLETKGCHVSTLGANANIPGFFVTDSHVRSPFNFQNAGEAAKVIKKGLDFGLKSGYVFCVPVPEHLALDSTIAKQAIEYALLEAKRSNIGGKETTPFLLKKVWEATGGVSVKTNVEFVKNNARMAAQIAIELANSCKLMPAEGTKVSAPTSTPTPPTAPPSAPPTTLGKPLTHQVDVAAIGALSQDITCTLNAEHVSVSSYPGHVSTSLGGTAYNVALASAYSGARTRLVSQICDKDFNEISKTVSPALDVSGVKLSINRTSRYVSTNDKNGDLIIACADMDAISDLPEDFIKQELLKAMPKVCVFDGNLGEQGIKQVLQLKKLQQNTMNSDPIVIFEPTSVPKAARLANQQLSVFPNNQIDIITPNHHELMSMYEEFSFKDKFDISHWFPVIDELNLSDAVSRMKLDIFSRSHESLKNVVQSGLVQASVQLLPYIPNIFVTTGSNGVISFQLVENLKDRTGGVLGGANSVYILSKRKPFGILIQHFPVEHQVPKEEVRSVNGIGDTFCGVLASQLAHDRSWLRDDGPRKFEAVDRAMHAASMSLRTWGVSSEIATVNDQ